MTAMIGTIVNAAGILLGGLLGLTRKRALPAASEAFFKVAVGAFIVFYGIRLTWLSINGSFGQMLKQIFIVALALFFGKLAGRLLRLQKASNRIGRAARERMLAARPDDPQRASEGFKTCAALFCAAPLAFCVAMVILEIKKFELADYLPSLAFGPLITSLWR